MDRTIRSWVRAVAEDAEDPLAQLRLGLALRRTGDLDGARAALLRAAELAPEREAPRAALRLVLSEVASRDLPDGDGRIAGYAVRRLLETVPDEAPLRTFLASDLAKMKRVVLRVRSHVGGPPAEDYDRLGVRVAPTLELRHPNVVPLLGTRLVIVEHPRRAHAHHVLVGEHEAWPTVDRLIALGPLEPARAARILREVLLACEAAHDRGVVHRLLSPRKIHVQGDRVRVRDFGLALFLGARGGLGTAVLAYAPPEVLVAGPCDERTDLWSAGAIAWALLAGAPPFGDSRRDRLRSMLSSTPAPLPHGVRAALPAGLEELVMRLLARKPEERPENARAALVALERLG